MSARTAIKLAALGLALSACPGTGPVSPVNLPPDISRACAVTERKCTACHERERWLDARHSPAEWRDIVDEMRLLPGSGITVGDSEDALRCLNYRSSSVGLPAAK